MYSAPPPPPQKSDGCFKGCCIVAAILGVLGVIGAVVLGLTWKKWTIGLVAAGTIDQCPDLSPDEKKEARDLLQKGFDAVTGEKSADQKFVQDFMEEFNRLGQVGQDGRVEGKEIRPIMGRIKKLLRDAGYGSQFPSSLFPYMPPASGGAILTGDWEVVVTKVTDLDAAAKVLAEELHISETTARASFVQLPATVATKLSESAAGDLAAALQEAGCGTELKRAVEKEK
jgi:hypothetical protein